MNGMRRKRGMPHLHVTHAEAALVAARDRDYLPARTRSRVRFLHSGTSLMALLDITRSPVDGSGLLGRLSATLAHLVSALAVWNETRVTRKALSQLSDRELDDIGLCRGDIDDIASRLAR
jgi:uncharacterized protein YjiS (DUF1127 family)